MNSPRFSEAYGPVGHAAAAGGERARARRERGGDVLARAAERRRERSRTCSSSAGDGLALRVFEVGAAGGDERLEQAPAAGPGPVALPDAEAQRGDLAVVAIGQLPVGVVVGDADERLARRVDVDAMRRLPSRASKPHESARTCSRCR